MPEVLTDEFHIKREDLVGRPMIKDQVVNFPPETIVDMRLRREFKIAYAGPNNRGIRDSTVISYWGEEVFYRSTGIRPEHGIATFSSEGVKIREFSTSSDPDDDPRNRE